MTDANVTDGVDRRNAYEQLRDSGWAVRLSRSLIEDHSNPEDFGALVVLAAAMAWRDRGRGWGRRNNENEFMRDSAERPPGGWAALVGVTHPTWRAWRNRAIALDLIRLVVGATDDGHEVNLITVLRGLVPEGEQFARIPTTVLLNPAISRTAKRAYLAIALYRSGTGWSSAAIGTIAAVAGIAPRNARIGVRQLEQKMVIVPTGCTRRGTQKWVLPSLVEETCKLKASVPPPKVQTESQRPPPTVQTESGSPPQVKASVPLSGDSSGIESQEGCATTASDGPTPRNEAKISIESAKALSADRGLQGEAAKPAQPRWRTMTDTQAVKFFVGMTASDIKAAVKDAETCLVEASEVEASTLTAMIADYHDRIDQLDHERIAA